MKIGKLSARQRFLRWCFPCAENRIGKPVNPKVLKRLKRLVNYDCEPSTELLTKVFPDAVRSFLEFSMCQGRVDDPWSPDNVAEFWRFHHKEGHSPVIKATVSSFVDHFNEIVKVTVEGQEMIVINLYRLPLEIDREVFIHNRVLVEVME